jgi:flagellar hook-associated protein 3 FlgL
MRITSFAIFNQLTKSLHENLRTLSGLGNKLGTGKKLNNLSDDIPDLMRSMDFKLSINAIEQYQRNINEADARLSYAETTLISVSNALTSARTRAQQAANGTLTAVDRNSIAQEIKAIRDQVLNLSNSTFRNKYIFSGYATDTQSFDASFNYQGDAGVVDVKIDKNATVSLNIAGDTVFGSGASNIMNVLDTLYTDLTNADQTVAQAGAQAALTTIDASINQIANIRAELGARLNYIDDRKNNLADRNFTLQTLLSEAEDTDIAETASEFAKTEVALQSLRQSGAKILSQSLLDFIN